MASWIKSRWGINCGRWPAAKCKGDLGIRWNKSNRKHFHESNVNLTQAQLAGFLCYKDLSVGH